MKSEFILAFNEITEMRGLSKDVVMGALETALVSAYRRSIGATAAQIVQAEIDQATGQAHIYVEKEVVEEIADDRTEVTLAEAREYEPEAALGDMVMVEVDSSARGLGRIAAQTAKQVILQRIREAERDAQYEEYIEREGEIINGTVQSVTPVAVTIGLGRTEALLPRSQQVPGEIYRPHDKVRAYVLEVRKTNRGPQIVVSRSHRNMLRRLLEYEVPEIYNGQVEIKNIAREAGHRSKVAVAALQEGVDPVGACVGMRGVRIQSIVRELNDEKIDVIEWNPDQATFIAKALSPARVSGVYLDDDPDEGRTATVIVPDDQLSLAIGREGQNARLAAKLTGWRIDIKSVTEASFDAMRRIAAEEPAIQPLAEAEPDLITEVQRILEKKEAKRPVMPEEYKTLTIFTGKAEEQILSVREVEREVRLAALEEIRSQVPGHAYDLPTDLLEDLDPVLHDILVAAGYDTIGKLMEQRAINESKLAALDGFDETAMEELTAVLDNFEMPPPPVVEPEPEVVAEAEAAVEAEPEAEAEAEEAVEAAAEAVETAEVAAEVAEEIPTEPIPVVGAPAESTEEPAPPAFPDVEEEEEEPEAEPATLVAQDTEEDEKPDVGKVLEEASERFVYMEDDIDLDEDVEEDKKRKRRKDKQRRRQLVFDEEVGDVVAKRRRKGSRKTEDWDEYLDI